jgi:hypothetical protein
MAVQVIHLQPLHLKVIMVEQVEMVEAVQVVVEQVQLAQIAHQTALLIRQMEALAVLEVHRQLLELRLLMLVGVAVALGLLLQDQQQVEQGGQALVELELMQL